MARKKPKTIAYRRKREQKTNYGKRIRLLFSGKPRLVVRFTNQRVIAQVISFETTGDKVMTGVDSSMLRKHDWKYSLRNLPAAYLTGLLLAKKATAGGASEVLLDVGFKTPLHKGVIYAFLKGCLDGGLNVPHGDESIYPSEDRLQGKHIADYAVNLKKSDEAKYKALFAEYLKNGAQPENMVTAFEVTKKKILG